ASSSPSRTPPPACSSPPSSSRRARSPRSSAPPSSWCSSCAGDASRAESHLRSDLTTRTHLKGRTPMSQSTPTRPTTTQPGAVTSHTGAPRRGRFRTLTPIATVALASLALAACSPAASGSAGDASAEATTASAEAPSRIVGVSSDVSDMALLLAGPERVAAVSESSRSPHMGMVPDLARQVEGTIPAGVEPDAEQILTHAPDLVLTTARHAGERSVGDQLAD